MEKKKATTNTFLKLEWKEEAAKSMSKNIAIECCWRVEQ